MPLVNNTDIKNLLLIQTSSLSKQPRFFIEGKEYYSYKYYRTSRFLQYRLKKKQKFSRFIRRDFYLNTVLHVHITRSNIFITLTTLTGKLIFKVTPKIVRQYLR